MTDGTERSGRPGLFESQRTATRYRILVEIADHQPAVSQREIADAIGVTTQAVSDHVQGLVEDGYVASEGRGRYEVTNEGVDWMSALTDDLDDFVTHVHQDVIEQVEIDTAIATARIAESEPVSLAMRDGVLRATPGDAGATTAVAATAADEDEDVGVTDVQGVLDYDLGSVTIAVVPDVEDGGSGAVDPHRLTAAVEDAALVVVAGVESLVAVETVDVAPDARFGTAATVTEAVTRGLDVALVVVRDQLSRHTDALRDANIAYEVVDVTA